MVCKISKQIMLNYLHEEYNMLNDIIIRKAMREDLPQIIYLLATDSLGKQREQYQDPLPEQYYRAFAEIAEDENQQLIVAEYQKKIIGTLQLTFIPYLSFQGGKRALVESVRIDDTFRGKG